MEQLFKAIFLGILEGLTEFLPVSSTAHLLVVGDLIDFQGPPGHVFEIFIQLGAILAVVFLYRARFINMALAWPFDAKARHFLYILIVATIPALLAGFFARDFIKNTIYDSTFIIALALIIGGVVMIAFERLPRKAITEDPQSIPLKTAAIVGCFQAMALIPGVSRSGASIIGGLAMGLSRKAAAELSFLLAVPVMFAAVTYDTYKSWGDITAVDGFGILAAGFVAAFVTAIVVIKFALSIIARYGFFPFAIYRIVIGAGLLVMAL